MMKPEGIGRRLARTLIFGLGLFAAFAGNVSPCYAASMEWSFEVLELIRVDQDTHLILLRPTPRGSDFPRSCENFVIHSFYDLEDWSSEGRAQVSRSGHERSVQFLAQAQVLHQIVRIRAVGQGFGALSESSKCEVTSRGFTLVLDPGGEPVIFSVYEDPEGTP